MMVGRLNYCTQAIEDIRRMQRERPEMHEPNLDLIINWLDSATKISLPDHGDLFDLTLFDQRHADQMKLPYPIVAVEAPFPLRPGEILPSTQAPSSKRIGLYVEMSAAEMLGRFPGSERPNPNTTGVLVIPVFYSDSAKVWVVGAAATFVPYGQKVFEIANALSTPASSAHLKGLQQQNRQLSKIGIGSWLVPLRLKMLDGLRTVHGLTDTQIKTIMLTDVSDEQIMFLQLCTVLTFGNVDQIDVPVPDDVVQTRAETGRAPLYNYKVLVLSED